MQITLTTSPLPQPKPNLTAEQTADITHSAANRVHLLIQKNFIRLAQKTHSRHYWGNAASTTTVTPNSPTQYTITIPHKGVRLHWKGGTVRPTGKPSEVTGKPTKTLLIPFENSPLRKRDITLAEARIPNENIHILKSKTGAPILVASKNLKRKTNLIFLGTLVKKATHHPRPDIIPSQNELATAAQQGALERLNQIIRTK